jgi:hypothetical protein
MSLQGMAFMNFTNSSLSAHVCIRHSYEPMARTYAADVLLFLFFVEAEDLKLLICKTRSP